MIKTRSIIFLAILALLFSACTAPKKRGARLEELLEKDPNASTSSDIKNLGDPCKLRSKVAYLKLGLGEFKDELANMSYLKEAKVQGQSLVFNPGVYGFSSVTIPNYLVSLAPNKTLNNYTVKISPRDLRNVIFGMCNAGRMFNLSQSGDPAFINVDKTILRISKESYGVDNPSEDMIIKTWFVIQALKGIGLIAEYDGYTLPSNFGLKLSKKDLPVFVFDEFRISSMQ
jgi:hypothetical protein